MQYTNFSVVAAAYVPHHRSKNLGTARRDHVAAHASSAPLDRRSMTRPEIWRSTVPGSRRFGTAIRTDRMRVLAVAKQVAFPFSPATPRLFVLLSAGITSSFFLLSRFRRDIPRKRRERDVSR